MEESLQLDQLFSFALVKVVHVNQLGPEEVRLDKCRLLLFAFVKDVHLDELALRVALRSSEIRLI